MSLKWGRNDDPNFIDATSADAEFGFYVVRKSQMAELFRGGYVLGFGFEWEGPTRGSAEQARRDCGAHHLKGR